MGNPMITDRVGVQIENYKKSIELLKVAQAEDLPSRAGHGGRVIINVIATFCFLTIRIGSAVENVFRLLILPFYSSEPNKKQVACYRLIRLGVIDPLHIVTEGLISIFKIGAVFCGIFRPSMAQSGYILATTVLLKFSELKQSVREKLSIGIHSPQNAQPIVKKLEPLHPGGALGYLGLENAKKSRDAKEIDSVKGQHEKAFKRAANRAAKVYATLFDQELAEDLKASVQDPLVFKGLLQHLKQVSPDFKVIKEMAFKMIDPRPDGGVEEKAIYTAQGYDDLKAEKEQAELLKIDRIKVIISHMQKILPILEKKNFQENEKKAAVNMVKDAIPKLQGYVDEYNAAIECQNGFGAVFVKC